MEGAEMSRKGSHYTPAYTRVRKDEATGATYEETACGLFVGVHVIAPVETEPTCPACRSWLSLPNEPETAEVQR